MVAVVVWRRCPALPLIPSLKHLNSWFPGGSCLEIRKYGLAQESMSLEVGFEVSKNSGYLQRALCLLLADQDVNLQLLPWPPIARLFNSNPLEPQHNHFKFPRPRCFMTVMGMEDLTTNLMRSGLVRANSEFLFQNKTKQDKIQITIKPRGNRSLQ